MQEGSKGLVIKLVLMALTALAGYLHVNVPEAQLYAFATDAVDISVLLYGFWRTYGQKLVPHDSVALKTLATVAPVGEITHIVSDDGLKAAVKVVGALLIGVLVLGHDTARAATPPAGPCNLLTLFQGLTPANFNTKLAACTSADFQAALADANTVPVDNMAVSCLQPASQVIAALEAMVKGDSGAVTAFQKFRRAKQSGVIGNCLAYVNSTTMLQ